MKKLLIRMTALIAAACMMSSSLPVSAMYITTPTDPAIYITIRTDEGAEAFHQRYPLVYQDAVEFTYLSDGDTVYRGMQPHSQILSTVEYSEADEKSLRELTESVFDDSYGISVFPVSTSLVHGTAWSVQVYDPKDRAETEEKADQLFEILHEKYTLYEYEYYMHVERYTQFCNSAEFCVYQYRSDFDLSASNYPEIGEDLIAFIAEEYPEWEVLTEEGTSNNGEKEWGYYSVRKKGVTNMYDIPVSEYLAMRDTIYQKLGCYELLITSYPEPTVINTKVKYYLGGSGDLNEDGDLSIADGVLLSRVVAEDETVPVTESGLKEADINCDGLLTVLDINELLCSLTNPADEDA